MLFLQAGLKYDPHQKHTYNHDMNNAGQMRMTPWQPHSSTQVRDGDRTSEKH